MSPTFSLVGAGILVLLAGLCVWPTFADARPLRRRRRTAAWCVGGALALLLAAGLLAHPPTSSDDASRAGPPGAAGPRASGPATAVRLIGVPQGAPGGR